MRACLKLAIPAQSPLMILSSYLSLFTIQLFLFRVKNCPLQYSLRLAMYGNILMRWIIKVGYTVDVLNALSKTESIAR